ncbi:PREDICTED: uncharacterized protein LOC108578180 [Habropoda laboriosa]|uniref:uncharacterized protein LOC108578180 n=1 Tax=Habropoda laboriosa TaxID=597456 RepID=UPI00083CCAD6|nr:PREDICTED: uncharacterized protein LOC108578180 [Habropoda laboriosa]
MARRDNLCSIVEKCVFLTFLVAVHVAGREICDKTKCPGPLKYYESLGCTPVYEKPGDCCATEYDCGVLKDIKEDKCYANGHEYNVGEALRDEDRNPCDIGCFCGSYGTQSDFICAAVDCASFQLQNDNCFYRHRTDECCPEYVCLKDGEERAICDVESHIYLDGEYFKSKSDPDLECTCMPGFKGEEVEPFCKKPNRDYCSPLFHHADALLKKCAPVFYNNQSPQKDCNVFSRCQNANDTVIPKEGSTKTVSEKENKMCQFGNMMMHIGDELKQGTDYDSTCIKCVCEVPPTPTCQRLPDDVCDVTSGPLN